MMCKQVIVDYMQEKSRLLGELNENVQSLDSFFAKTLRAQKNLNYEKFLLSTQIGHRLLQHVDLHYKNAFLTERDWQCKKIGFGRVKVAVCIDEKIEYTSLNLTALNYNQRHCFTLVAQGEKWLIESHAYEDDFKGTFKQYKNLYTSAQYAKIRDDYLAKVKETLANQKCIERAGKTALRRESTLDREDRVNGVGWYNREKAVAYAKKYALVPNSPPWGNYEALGGDCTNFVSQCLYAGGIPFDEQGTYEIEKWYWYSERRRVPTWTSANAFKDYMLINKKGGLKASLETFDKMILGDVVQLGDLKHTRHSMLIVGYIEDENGDIVDVVIAQHSISETARGDDIPLSTKPLDRLYWHIEGYYK